jgi:hypothetical protein
MDFALLTKLNDVDLKELGITSLGEAGQPNPDAPPGHSRCASLLA